MGIESISYLYWYLDQVPIIKSFSSVCPVAMEFALMRMTMDTATIYGPLFVQTMGALTIQTLVLRQLMTSEFPTNIYIYFYVLTTSWLHSRERGLLFHASYIRVCGPYVVILLYHTSMKSEWYTKGHFTHETEGPCPFHFKHSHCWKRRSRSKFASHYA